MIDLRQTLRQLSEAFGPSGAEKAVRKIVRQEIQDSIDQLDVDAMGNMIALKLGEGPAPRLKVMVASHMDEVGFMITQINKNGSLGFMTVGGVDARLLLGKRLVIGDRGLAGIIGAAPSTGQPSEAGNRVLEVDDLTIDIGASDEKAANGRVKVGDSATFATQFRVLSEDPAWPTVLGKAFDDRAGCTALIALLKSDRYPVDLYGVFTVQEEVGLRGARVAAHRIGPEAAFVLEGTICDDLPQPPGEDSSPVTRLGGGPAITLMDRSVVSHPGLLRLLQDTAADSSIAVQYKAPGLGGTDGGAIHLTGEGVPSVAVAVPCRYIHGPAAILNLNDLSSMVQLIDLSLRRISAQDLVR